MFSRRVIRPELLDHAPAEEARRNLKDLVTINRRFGGHSTIRSLLAHVARPDEPFTVLDVGSASGDTARLLKDLYQKASITSLDCNPVNLEAAPEPKLLADAFRLPFAPGAFDFVISTLFLHHFTNEQVISLLREFHSIARRAVLIVDLERHIVPYLFLRVAGPLFKWGWITVHDGLISVKAAFRASELAELARSAGMHKLEMYVHRPAFRIAMIAGK